MAVDTCLSESDIESVNQINQQETLSENQIRFALAEYSNLRNEIIKRSDNRLRIISFTLLIAGTMISFGLQPNSPSYVLFVFPILGSFLASLWVHNILWTARISAYIERNIEVKFKWSGWESQVAKTPHSQSWLVKTTFSIRGIFLSTEIIAMLLGFLKLKKFTMIDIVLIICATVSIFLTWIVLQSTKRSSQ